MRIIWTRFAIDSLKDIYTFYLEIAGAGIASRMRMGIVSEAKKIVFYPYSGQKQESLSSFQKEHRYFLKGHFKIIYRISNNEL